MHDVQGFAEEKGLTDHVALLRKGALVAQDPSNYENIEGPEKLNDEEKMVIENEVSHKWRMPMKLYLTIATCSIGAAVQGWDQTGSNGATIFFPKHYHIGGDSVHDTMLVGLVNAGPYIGSALIGCWLSDPLNNYFGRRGKALRRCLGGKPAPWPTCTLTCRHRCHLLCCPLLYLARHRIRLQPYLAAAACQSPPHGHWNGCQGLHRAHLRR